MLRLEEMTTFIVRMCMLVYPGFVVSTLGSHDVWYALVKVWFLVEATLTWHRAFRARECTMLALS